VLKGKAVMLKGRVPPCAQACATMCSSAVVKHPMALQFPRRMEDLLQDATEAPPPSRGRESRKSRRAGGEVTPAF